MLGLLEWYCSRWQEAWLKNIYKTTNFTQTRLGPVGYHIIGSPPYVLQIHGQMGSADQVTIPDLISPWQRAGFGIIAPNRPGYRNTPVSSGRTMAEQADLYAALLDELGVDKVVVNGGSAGGPSSIEFAARYPNRTHCLLLTVAITGTKKEEKGSPAQGVRPDGTFPLSSRILFRIAVDPIISWAEWQWIKTPDGAIDGSMGELSNFTAEEKAAEKQRIKNNPKDLRIVMEMMKASVPVASTWDGTINDVIQFNNLTLPLEKVKCPTLLAYGKHDSPISGVPIHMAYNAHERMPQSELMILKRGWHLLWVAPDYDQVVSRSIVIATASLKGSAHVEYV